MPSMRLIAVYRMERPMLGRPTSYTSGYMSTTWNGPSCSSMAPHSWSR